MTVRELSAGAQALDLRARADQEAPTRRRLLPRIEELLALLRVHREAVDADFLARRDAAKASADAAAPLGEARLAGYPVGFCHQIRDQVWVRLSADPAFHALCGGEIELRKVFVLLKGRYFQNALQIGNLYVDVANDTVFAEKPKLEWARIAEVDYQNADDWTRVAEVGRRYYEVELYPNLAFPFLFPAAPFFAVRSSGRLDLFFAQNVLFLKDLGEGMRRAKALAESFARPGIAPLPEAYARRVRESCAGNLQAAFPVEYAPSSPDDIVARVLPEFEELGRSPDDLAHGAVVENYLRLVQHATRRLALMDLRPVEPTAG